MKTTGSIPVFALVAALLTCEKIDDFCGMGEVYDPSCEFCYGSAAYPLCGGGKYNPLTEGCDRVGSVGTKCQDGSAVPRGTPCGGYTLTVAALPDAGGSARALSPRPSFGAGDDITLVAEPSGDYDFVGWAGALSSSSASANYRMAGVSPHVAIVAMFKPKGAGKLITEAFPEAGGTVTATPPPQDGETYAAGVEVRAEARAYPGYVFDGWSGASASKDASVAIVMNESKTLVAVFVPSVYRFRASVSPEGSGAVFVNGAALFGDASRDVGAAISVWAQPADGYVFDRWTGPGADGAAWQRNDRPTIAIETADGAMALTANFTRGSGGAPPPPMSCALSVPPPSGGGVSLIPSASSYTVGTRVTATAAPDSGYRFVKWSGASESTNASVTITMDGDKTLSATFEIVPPNIKTYSLATYTDPQSGVGGTVVNEPSAPSYNEGTVVRVTAAPKEGYRFIGWSGAASGTTNPLTIMMDGDKTLTATFEAVPAVTPADTANVPFIVNVGAAVRAVRGSASVQISVAANTQTTLRLPLNSASGESWTIESWTITVGGAAGYVDSVYTGNFVSGANPVQTITLRPRGSVGGGGDNNCTGAATCKSVTIGGVKWMAENLNIETANSYCYGNSPDSCAKYGRLYTWSAAMTACPSGWHLPTRDEWGALAIAAGGTGTYGTGGTAGRKLKSTTGWNYYSDSYYGTDEYGFTALPGGGRYSDGSFYDAGDLGFWWAATEYGGGGAYGRYMDYGYDDVNEYYLGVSNGFSVRCVGD